MTNHFETAIGIGAKIQKGEITSVAVTEELLGRISVLDQRLKSFVTVTGQSAIEAARRADVEISEGNIRSVLHGVPIAIKDLLDTQGIKTTYGMKVYENNLPQSDATVVRRLKEAGCILLGKLKLTEGAYARHHPDVEVPINPWNEDCWTGVSSSGSGVATAAGLCFASIGSDTGGSIRFPSAANGLVGLKPTWGRVSRAGAFPLAYTLDHMGPMVRSVQDAAAMLGIIAGRDDEDPTSSFLPVDDYLGAASGDGDLSGISIGVDWSYCRSDVETDVFEAVEDAVSKLKELGATLKEVSIPYEAVTAGWPITCGVETAHAHRETYPSRKEEYGAIGALIDLGRSVSVSSYLEHELVRRTFKSCLDGIFQNVDVLVCPSMPFNATAREGSTEADEAEENLAVTLKFTGPYDFSGSPTLSIPWSMGSKGIPLSIQMIGRDFEESTLVRVGYALEQTGGYDDIHPEL